MDQAMIGEYLARLAADDGCENSSVYRDLLKKVVNDSLKDADSIAERYKQDDSKITDDINTLLSFLHHIVNQCPQVLCASDETSTADRSSEEDCLNVTNLLISHLLAIAVHPGCSSFTELIVEEIVFLLRTICTKGPHIFSRLIKELVGCLADLTQISNRMFSGEVDDSYQPTIDKFPYPGWDSPLKITDEVICESLQTIVTDILVPLSSSICQFCIKSVSYIENDTLLLWSILGCQIHYGEVTLKTTSLKLVANLLQYSGLPRGQPCDYFVACFVALIDLLASGCDECEGDWCGLEDAATECLHYIIEVGSQPQLLADGSRQVVYSCLHDGLSDCINTYGGLHNLRTDSLRSKICATLSILYRIMPRTQMNGKIMVEKRKEVVSKLIEDLGCKMSMQYMVPLLREAVVLDLPHYSSTESNLVGSSLQSEASPDNEPQGRKRRLSLLESPSKKQLDGPCSLSSQMSDYSTTATIITEKLEELCSQLKESQHPQENNVCLLEGICVLLESLSWCQAFCTSSPSNVAGPHGSTPTSSRSSKSQIILSQYYSADNIGNLYQVWRRMLEYFMENLETKLFEMWPQCYKLIIQGIGALLAIQDVARIPSEQLHGFTWILSLYWLPNDISWHDLKPADHKVAGRIANALADKIDASCVKESLFILSLLPKEVASGWRSRVFQMAISDTKGDIHAAAIESFPLFLYHAGPNFNHLVNDHIHGSLQDKSSKVEASLARCAGTLACVVSRKAILHRIRWPLDRQPMHRSVVLRCVTCDGLEDIEVTHEHFKDRPKLVDPNMFVPFSTLLKAEDVSTRLSMVKSFEHICHHLSMRANNSATAKILQACLQLLQDENREIRKTFSKIIPHLSGCHGNDSASETEKIICKSLEKVCIEARKTSSPAQPRMLETTLLAIAELAKVWDGDLLFWMLTPLLLGVSLPSCPLDHSLSHDCIKQISRYKKLSSSRLLFIKFAKDLCQKIVDHIHTGARQGQDALKILRSIIKAFDFDGLKKFLEKFQHFVIPPLVCQATSTASNLLSIIAKQLGNPNHYGPLANNIVYVYCHLVLTCDVSKLTHVVNFLKRECPWDLKRLLLYGANQENQLLLSLDTHYEQVLWGLKFLWVTLETIEGKTDMAQITHEDIVTVLSGKLLGLLVHFDKALNDELTPMRARRDVFASVVALMKLMGPRRITAVRLRLMTTLKIGLKFKEPRDFMELCCKAWHCFVRIVDINTLGPMLSQIVVNLLPLLKYFPAQVADIFNYLIVENRDILQPHFHELYYFMQVIPELADVNAVLENFTQNTYSQDLKIQISHLLKGTSHESIDVRQQALLRLRFLLRNNQKQLHQYILGSENVDPIVSNIATTLVTGCREADQTIRCLFGECLGELGAIDPGRLDLSKRPKEERSIFHESVNEENFIFDLINILAKAFLSAQDRTSQDCVSYAMQELMLYAQVTNDPSVTSRGSKLWKRFSEEVQEILVPLINSRYMVTMNIDFLSQATIPFYKSRKCISFKYWVTHLCGYLASKVADEKASKVFAVCLAVIRDDSQVALYLLPYVAVHIIIDGNEDHIETLRVEVLTVLNDMKLDGKTRHGSRSDLRHMSAQTTFSVLDYLFKWKRQRITRLTNAANAGSVNRRPVLDFDQDPGYRQVNGFLQKIPANLLAMASLRCEAYTRSMMHYEQFLKQEQQCEPEQDDIHFLQNLYAKLDEPDGVAGIGAIKKTLTTELKEQIRIFESTGQIANASVCYDRAAQLGPEELQYRQGLLSCRLQLGELNSAMDLANGMISTNPQWSGSLNAYRVEAAWKLGQWTKLESYLKPETNTHSWNVGLGKILLAARNRDQEEFLKQLQCVRTHLMGPLSAASMETGSYHRGYDGLVRLHMLTEIEEGVQKLLGLPVVAVEDQQVLELGKVMQRWQNRLVLTQSSFRTQEPILQLRRTVLGLALDSDQQDAGLVAEIKQQVGEGWLESARIAREAKLVQTAHSFLLSAEAYGLPGYCLEQAKWLWDRGDHDKAQNYLEKAVDEYYPDKALILEGAEVDPVRRVTLAKILLLLGQYSEETASQESNTILRLYKEVVKVNGKFEDGYFYLASYYDKLLLKCFDQSAQHKKGELMMHVIQNFGKSLQYGSKFIYQSMPRMLAAWLDYGAEVFSVDNSLSDTIQQGMRGTLKYIHQTMASFSNNLQPYQFLTAFPQLISRICHQHTDVFNQLSEIISKLLVVFPQQAVWMMMAVSKSSYPIRKQRCQLIFAKAKYLNTDLEKFLNDATKLTDRLLELCNKNVDNTSSTLSINTHFKPLQRLLAERTFSPIILPLQDLMTVTLPSSSVLPDQHDPFQRNMIYMRGIEDTVEVLPSLAKPKKITMRGSDGQLYIMLCKPKDDLRKDARLMEFNGIVNKCLKKDPESRKRDLHIRTYTVTPLNEECGLLEWVSNTTGLRHILLKLYRERSLYTSGKELKAMQLAPNAPVQRKLEIYKKELLPRHPAVFSDWFLRIFPDPTSWYNARNSYCRTTAVMSMVGYILGLGDRHGENILFDSTNGDCVHVDFNCLFNKGETFDYPEIVPFRLTHNMVEAMGPMSYEGVFRRACEVTLRVMRDQRDPLMSVLKTFIYDPLVEWSKPPRGRNNPPESGQIKNEKATSHVNNIEARLRGVTRVGVKSKPKGLPLSVEGHANHLIKEATDETNLCQMYIGWAPYM